MKKRGLVLLLVMTMLLSACSAAVPDAASSGAVTFSDDLGRQVTVDSPQRVAALLGSFAQIWQLAGGQVIATTDDAWDDLQLDLPEDTINIGSLASLSLELVLASEPDFILASARTRQHMEWKETLEATGIPVAYFEVENFSDYLRMLDTFTEITGRRDLYETNGLAVQSQIEEVLTRSRARVEQNGAPSVLCVVASAAIIRAKDSDGNVLSSILHALGCTNIADSDSLILENLSMEHILLSDPDYIFFVQRGDDSEGMRQYVQETLMNSPLWSQLTAVKENRVYFMEKNLFHLKPNNRWGEAYEILEDILQHE